MTLRLRFLSFSVPPLLIWASACSGVSPAEHSPHRAATTPASTTSAIASTPASGAQAATPAAPVEEIVPGRTVLGATAAKNLPTSVEPLPADRAVLLATHGADERESFVRWIDEAGHRGPVLRLRDEFVVTAFARSDGKHDLVTSDGDNLCFRRYAPDRADAEARTCAAIDAKAVTVSHQKLAVISLDELTVKVEKSVPASSVRKTKPSPLKTHNVKKPGSKPSSQKTQKKPAPSKKKPATKKKTPAKKSQIEKKFEIVQRDMDVLVSWATSDGFGETKRTGLKFVPPLLGMNLVDAKATPRGILLAWFEKGKRPSTAVQASSKGPAALGWASIQSGLIDEYDRFDETSKKLVVEGEYDWGFIRGFSGPRWVDVQGQPTLLTQKNPRGGECEITKMGDVLTSALPRLICGIDPGAGPNADPKTWESLWQAAPKRRPGQPKNDPELVAWAGDKGYFVTNDGRSLQSVKRDGSLTEEPAPFLARRVRMTYAQLLPDGSGRAVVDGREYRVDAKGEVTEIEQPAKVDITATVDSENRWIVPLPDGNTWRIDAERTRVLWADANGKTLAEAVWPEGLADAVCRDGVPGKKFVPSLVPGQFVEVQALAAPGICVVGHPVWAPDGSLRWWGTFSHGMDVLPEIRILKDMGKPGASPTILTNGNGGPTKTPCPPEMVLVDGKLCVDRFEATMVDNETGQRLAPDFPVTPNLFDIAIGDWATGRSLVGGVFARALPLPFIPEWQRGKKIDVRAVPLPHVRPNGYITGLVAESACTSAGKRLCTLVEFVLACRGEDDQQFPYGDTYTDGVCNVKRDVHPAATLHDNASIGHLDPRLNRVRVHGETLLQSTGESPQCRSRWGQDAIYDMVGNLDEWIDEGPGAFAGGFYARSTRAGCDAVITAHPKNYLDYSTGVRCCKDATK